MASTPRDQDDHGLGRFRAVSAYGPAFRGQSQDGGSASVEGYGAVGRGMVGRSTLKEGVYGESSASSGVHGRSTNSYGVHGTSATNTGIFGASDSGVGIQGRQSVELRGLRNEWLQLRRRRIERVEHRCRGLGDSGEGVYRPERLVECVHGFSNGTGAGVHGESALGRGGRFKGKKAQIRLDPSTAATHPTSGAAGDLFLDASTRLWLCKGGTSWVRLDTSAIAQVGPAIATAFRRMTAVASRGTIVSFESSWSDACPDSARTRGAFDDASDACPHGRPDPGHHVGGFRRRTPLPTGDRPCPEQHARASQVGRGRPSSPATCSWETSSGGACRPDCLSCSSTRPQVGRRSA